MPTIRTLARAIEGRRGERGQTATEYVLTIAVLVIGMVAATSAFTEKRGPFHRGMQQLSNGIGNVIAEEPHSDARR